MTRLRGNGDTRPRPPLPRQSPPPHRSGAERPGRRGTTGGRPPPRSRLGNTGGEALPRARPLAHLGQVPGPRTALAAPPLRPAPLRSAPTAAGDEPRASSSRAAEPPSRLCRSGARAGGASPPRPVRSGGPGGPHLPEEEAARAAGSRRRLPAAPGAVQGRHCSPRSSREARATALREGWRDRARLSEPFK